MEVRVYDSFLSEGVSWHTLHLVAARAKDLLNGEYPLSHRRFKTDGLTIYSESVHETGQKVLLDLKSAQHCFDKVLKPYLRDVEFGTDDLPTQWWPLGQRRKVILDPERSFGQPIVSDEGVPTYVLANAYKAMHDIASVAGWYDVSERAVEDAIEFERNLPS